MRFVTKRRKATALKQERWPLHYKRGDVLTETEILVAETGADGDLVTALRTAAAEHCGSSLGLHAGKEAVGLGAVAAVRLKSTLWHGTLYSCAGSSWKRIKPESKTLEFWTCSRLA